MWRQKIVMALVGLVLGWGVMQAEAATTWHVMLSWEAATGEDTTGIRVNIYQQADCRGTFVKLTPQPILYDQQPYDTGTVAFGKLNCWNATAVNSLGMEGDPSETVSFQMPTAPKPFRSLRPSIKQVP